MSAIRRISSASRSASLVSLLLVAAGLLMPGLAAAALKVSVVAGPNPVRAAQEFVAEYVVTNDGGTSYFNVTMESVIPTGVATISMPNDVTGNAACSTGSTSCVVGATIIWTIGSLAPGDSVTVRAGMQIATGGSTPPDGTDISIGAEVFDATVSQDTDSTTVTVQSSAALNVLVTDDRDPATPSGTLIYKVSYGNVGALTLPGVELSLDLPAEVTFVSATGGGVLNGSTVTWALGTNPPGANGQEQVVVQVNGGTTDGTTLKAEASINDQTAPTANEAAAAQLTQVETSPPPIAVAVILDEETVESNHNFLVHILASNTGSVLVSNVQLEMPVPEWLNSILTTSISDGGACNGSTCTAGETISWALGSIGAGQSKLITLKPQFTGGSGGASDGTFIPLEAMLSVPIVGTVKSVREMRVVTDRLFDIWMEADKDPVAPGDDLTYTIRFGNRSGISVAPGTVLTMRLPADTAFVSATDGGSESGGVVTWSLGNVTPGEVGQRQVTVTADALLDDGSLLETEARIEDASFPKNFGGANLATAVSDSEPLQVQMDVVADPVLGTNQYALINLTATNQGLTDLFNVTIDLRIPREFFGFAPVNGVLGGGTCSSNCDPWETVTWTLGTLPAGDGTTVTIQARTTTTAGLSVDGTAIGVSALVQDGLGKTARARTSAQIDSGSILELSVDTSADPVIPGAGLLYTITYGNSSAATVTPGTNLTFELPDGVTFIAATDGGSLSGNTVSWPIGNLSPGTGGQRGVAVQVDGGTAVGTVLRADATIADASLPSNQARASGLVRTAAAEDSPLSISVQPSQDPVGQSQFVTNDVMVTNNSLVDMFNVQVELAYPEELTTASTVNITDGGNCNNSSCSVGETMRWLVGTLPAGAGRTFSFSAQTQAVATAKDGAIIIWDARASDGLGKNASVRRTVRIEGDSPLAAALEESRDPVPASCRMTYTVDFGNPSSGTVTPSTVMALGLPPETEFVTADGGGQFIDGAVVWDLGDVAPGTFGRARVTVKAPAENGTLLEGRSGVTDLAFPPHLGRSNALTRVGDDPLRLRVEVVPDVAAPGETVEVKYILVNTTGSGLFSVKIAGHIPPFLNSLTPVTHISGNGACNNSTCQAGELVVWDIGSLPQGATTVQTLTATVRNFTVPPDGTLLRFTGYGADGLGKQSTSTGVLRIGTAGDELALPAEPWVKIQSVPDVNSNNAEEVAAVMQMEGSTTMVEVRDSASGGVINSWTVLNPNWSPVDFTIVEGFDANPGPEIALLMVQNSGLIRVEMFDIVSGVQISSRPYFSSQWTPKQIGSVPSIGGGSAPDLVISAVLNTGKIIAAIRDAETDAFVRNVQFLSPAWNYIDGDIVDGFDANPGTELALLATNANGRLVTMIKDGGTNIFIKNVFHLGPAWTPRDLFVIPDAAASGNGVNEMVVLATNDFGQIIAMVKDGATNTFLYNAFFLNRDWVPVGIVGLPDINGGGDLEFGLLGQNICSGESLVQIKDSATNVFIRNVNVLTPDFFPLGLEEVEVNGQPAVAALGYDPNGVAFLVQVKNASTGAFIKNLNFFQ